MLNLSEENLSAMRKVVNTIKYSNIFTQDDNQSHVDVLFFVFSFISLSVRPSFEVGGRFLCKKRKIDGR